MASSELDKQNVSGEKFDRNVSNPLLVNIARAQGEAASKAIQGYNTNFLIVTDILRRCAYQMESREAQLATLTMINNLQNFVMGQDGQVIDPNDADFAIDISKLETLVNLVDSHSQSEQEKEQANFVKSILGMAQLPAGENPAEDLVEEFPMIKNLIENGDLDQGFDIVVPKIDEVKQIETQLTREEFKESLNLIIDENFPDLGKQKDSVIEFLMSDKAGFDFYPAHGYFMRRFNLMNVLKFKNEGQGTNWFQLTTQRSKIDFLRAGDLQVNKIGDKSIKPQEIFIDQHAALTYLKVAKKNTFLQLDRLSTIQSDARKLESSDNFSHLITLLNTKNHVDFSPEAISYELRGLEEIVYSGEEVNSISQVVFELRERFGDEYGINYESLISKIFNIPRNAELYFKRALPSWGIHLHSYGEERYMSIDDVPRFLQESSKFKKDLTIRIPDKRK